MGPARAWAGLTAVLAVAILAASASAATLTVVGDSKKVCQLTGETDWASGKTTDAQTMTRYGLFGIDLGFPVEGEHGTLYFLFGDARPNGHTPGSLPTVPPDDAVGATSRIGDPDSATCLDLKYESASPGTLDHPTVAPPIQQGSFNVPTGGVTVDGRLYAFFWTAHCLRPDPFGPMPATPMRLPPPSASCPEVAVSNSLGRSVLAFARPEQPTAFTQVEPIASSAPMPYGFVYVSAADTPGEWREPRPEGPSGARPGALIPVYGVPRYRQSIPYLAMAPRLSFGDVTTWSFYAGTGGGGPIWISYAQWQSGRKGGQWAPPAGAEIYANGANPYSPSGDEQCVGEHSVTWNAPLAVWLMTYTCGAAQVEARWAPDPWGPWSAPTILLSAIGDPGLRCTLFWNKPGAGGCPGLVSQQGPAFSFGAFYAPFVMARFTETATPKGGGDAKAATIYWLLSTWDPYQVTVMRSKLELTPADEPAKREPARPR